jgi:2,3-bisphosphoglycerate-dependent phosphoglycerate mutase
VFALRAITWWKNNIDPYVKALNVSKKHSLSAKDVLITTHGGFVSALLRTLVEKGEIKVADGVRIDSRCHNASVSVVEIDGTSLCGTLVKYSDISHLSGARPVGSNADVSL